MITLNTLTITDTHQCHYCQDDHILTDHGTVSLCLNSGERSINKQFEQTHNYLLMDYRQSLDNDYEGITDLYHQMGQAKYHHAIKCLINRLSQTILIDHKKQIQTDHDITVMNDTLIHQINEAMIQLSAHQPLVRQSLLSVLKDQYVLEKHIDAGAYEFKSVICDMIRTTDFSIDLLSVYVQFIEALIVEGKEKEASKAYKAMMTFDQGHDNDEVQYYMARAKCLMGHLYYGLGKSVKALYYYEKAETILEHMVSTDEHFRRELVTCLYYKGKIYERFQRSDLAEEEYEIACEVLLDHVENTQTNDVIILHAMLFERMVAIHLKQDDYDLADETYSHMVGMLHDAVLIRPDIRVIRTYVDALLSYASYLESIDEEDEAYIHYETAIKYLKRLLNDHDDFFYRYNLMAIAYKLMQHYQNSKPQKSDDYKKQTIEMLEHLILLDDDYLPLFQLFK